MEEPERCKDCGEEGRTMPCGHGFYCGCIGHCDNCGACGYNGWCEQCS